MTTYYVATRARYVLVDATSEDEARTFAKPALEALMPGAPVEIRNVRPATDLEIADERFHAEHLADNQ